jgi:alpha-tubulin suppressor-like RCC1 family protein
MSFRRVTVAAVALACSGCLEPTQITLEVRTDLPCSDVGETAIFVGPPGQLPLLPQAATQACSASGTLNLIGTYAAVPQDGAIELSTRVVLATKGISVLTDCIPSKNWSGCVVARRNVSFLPRRSLTVPVELLLVCEGIGCDDNSTCTSIGLCGSSQVDSSACQGNVCSQTLPLPGPSDGGAVPVPASPENSSFVAVPDVLPADGVSASTLTLTLRDALGNPLAGRLVSMNVSGLSNTWEATANATDSNGVLVALLRSMAPQTKTVTAKVAGLELRSTVTFGGPTDAGPLTGSTGVAVGDSHSCSLLAGGEVRCWGYGPELGDGTDFDRYVGTRPKGLPPVTALSSGYRHTCAVAIDGGTWCWGANDADQLATPSSTLQASNVPVFVSGLEPVRQIAAGSAFTCALTIAGAVKCWGQQSRPDANFDPAVPTLQPGLEPNCVSLAVGDQHACAVMSDGGVRCWGSQDAAELGNGVFSGVPSFNVAVIGLHGPALQLALGVADSCALLTSGEVQCWGRNADGQLGIGTIGGFAFLPTTVVGLSAGVIALASGERNACAVTVQGDVLCWGASDNFALTGAADAGTAFPTKVAGLSGPAIGVSGTWQHTCAVLDGGAVMCWGLNVDGMLGDGTMTDRPFPVLVREGP